MESKKEVAKSKTGRKLVMREKKVDQFTTLRTRHLLTACVCERCGFDLCETNGLGDYDDLTVEEKARVKQAIKKHKELHVVSEDRVINEEDLPSSYLRKPRMVG